MAFKLPFVDNAGALNEISSSDTIHPTRLGTTTATGFKYLLDSGVWTVPSFDLLGDVLITTKTTNDFVSWNGTKWVNTAIKTVGGTSILGTGDITLGTLNYWVKAGDTSISYTGSTNAIGTVNYNGGLEVFATNPQFILKQRTSNDSWRLQLGTNSGTSGGSNFVVYSITTNKVSLSASDNGNIVIGAYPDSITYANSRLAVYGGGNGANIDARGVSGLFTDQAVIELEGADYDTTPNSVYLRYLGSSSNTTPNLMGFSQIKRGELVFSNANSALIYSNTNIPIVFGVNSTEIFRLNSTGQITIGSIEYSTTLKPLGVAGTTGQYLKTTGTTNVWTTLTTSDISNFSSHNHTLDTLSNVTITTKATNDLLTWNGTAWINITRATLGIITNPMTTLGDIIYGGASGVQTRLGIGTTGQSLIVSSGIPAWGVTPVAGGGTGQSVYAIGDILHADTTTSLAKLADVAVGSYLRSGGVNTAPLWSTITLPNATAIGTIFYTSTANTVVASSAPILGTTGTQGSLGLRGTTSGTITITTAAAAGTYTLTLPNTAGTSGQVLRTDGSGVTSWIAASTGTVTSVSGSGGTTGLTLTGGAITTTGTLTLGGTLIGSNGGTGIASYVIGDLLYANTTTTLAKLAGTTTSVKNFLTTTGTGTVANVPAWAVLASGDITTALGFTPASGSTAHVVTGDVTGTGTVASIALTLATVATAGTYKSVTINAKGLVTSGTNPTTLTGYGITDAQGLNATLTSIAGLSTVTTGLIKLTNGVASLDTSTYLTSVSSTNYWTKTGNDLGYNTGNVGIGIIVPLAELHVQLPTQATATVNSLLVARFNRPQTASVKFANALDILIGSYSANVNSETRVDFKLNNGGTDVPDTTVMTLQANGTVGINTIPAYSSLALHIKKDTDTTINRVFLENNGTSSSTTGVSYSLGYSATVYTEFKFIKDSTTPYAEIGTVASLDFYLKTDNIQRVTIKSAGNVLIGSTTDSTLAKLQITGAIQYTTLLKPNGTAGTNKQFLTNSNGTQDFWVTPSLVGNNILSDVSITTPVTTNVLRYNGTNWTNATLTLSDISDYTATGVNYWVKTGNDVSYSAGLVSIGSTSAGSSLEVNRENSCFTLDAASSRRFGIIKKGGAGTVIATATGNVLPLGTWSTTNITDATVNSGTFTETMRLTSANRVLIGTTTENGVDKLQVNGSINVDGAIRIKKLGTTGLYIHTGTTYANGSGDNLFVGSTIGHASFTGFSNIVLGISAFNIASNASYNILIGNSAGNVLNTGDYNIFVGQSAGQNSKWQGRNVALGLNAGQFLGAGRTTSGNGFNVALGDNALKGSASTTCNYNSAVGASTMQFITTGSSNAGLGAAALNQTTTGSQNVAIGVNAMYSAKAQFCCVAIGVYALQNAWDTTTDTSSYNIAIGFNSMRGSNTPANNTGINNVAIGFDTLQSYTTAYNNTIIGTQAFKNSTTGYNNVAIGRNAGLYSTTGHSNVIIGQSACNGANGTSTYTTTVAVGSACLYSLTTGTGNTVLGFNAGWNLTTGNNNTIIGNSAGNTITTANNNTIIGSNLTLNSNLNDVVIVGAGNTERFSVTSAGRFNIGYTHSDSIANAKLQVNGGIYTAGDIYATANITSYSDRKLKSNIQNIFVGAKINSLSLKSYIKDGRNEIGIIAQDVKKIFPQLVTKIGGYLSVNHLGLISVSLQVGKENNSKIEMLEKRIAQLEKLLLK